MIDKLICQCMYSFSENVYIWAKDYKMASSSIGMSIHMNRSTNRWHHLTHVRCEWKRLIVSYSFDAFLYIHRAISGGVEMVYFLSLREMFTMLSRALSLYCTCHFGADRHLTPYVNTGCRAASQACPTTPGLIA